MNKFSVHPSAEIIFHNSSTGSEEINKQIKEFSKQACFKENRPVLLKEERTPQLLIHMFALLQHQVTYVPINNTYPEKMVKYISSQVSVAEYDPEVACIIFTSGTTGAPKGVEVTRSALFNFMQGIKSLIPYGTGGTIGCFSNASFDIFFLESMMALQEGVRVVLADEEEKANPAAIARLIVKHNIDILQLTPSRFQLLCNYDPQLLCLKNVKYVITGGEALPQSSLELLQKYTKARMFNMYGPTETTIYCGGAELTHSSHVHIGYPMPNVTYYLFNQQGKPAAKGEKGEIWIGGACLAKGYLNNQTQTKEKFVFHPQTGERLYKTGDCACMNPDGSLDFCGRLDNQVKLRGYRIELEAIEKTMNQFKGIIQSLVYCIKSNTDAFLYAMYMAEREIDISELKIFLGERLPSYMLPVKYQKVENFFLSLNGKLDRKKNLEAYPFTFSGQPEDMGKGELTVVLNIIQQHSSMEVLESDMDKSLNALGVSSIGYMHIIVALEERYDIEFLEEELSYNYFKNIGGLITCVEEHIKQTAPACV